MEKKFNGFACSLLDEKFLTLVVKKDKSCTIGMFSMQERGMENANNSWSVIHVGNEMISVIYADDYRIPKTQVHNNDNITDKNRQESFWRKNKTSFNQKASRIANHLDQQHVNCIIGDCAFVFEQPTSFTEASLQELVDQYRHV